MTCSIPGPVEEGNESMARVPTLKPDDVYQTIQSDPTALVVDVGNLANIKITGIILRQ